MTDVILPRIPSDLIELALADLVKCERSKKYIIEMDNWYVPHDTGPCEICLAGAVMAMSLGDGQKELQPTDFPKNSNKLLALNYFRQGDVTYGGQGLNISSLKLKEFDRDITEYYDNPGMFKREMRKLARDLRAAGY